DQGRLVGRHQAGEGERPAGGGQIGRVDVVLQRNGDAVQRAPDSALPALPVQNVGLIEGFRVNQNGGLQLVFVGSNAQQILDDELPRGGAALLHRRLHLGNARLDHAERPGISARLRQRHSDRDQDQHYGEQATQDVPPRAGEANGIEIGLPAGYDSITSRAASTWIRVVSRNGMPRSLTSPRIRGSSVPPRISPWIPSRSFKRSTIPSNRSRVAGRKMPFTSSFMYLS